MNQSIETTIKTIVFSGEDDDWPAYEEKALARAAKMGYLELMTGADKTKIPMDDEELDPNDEDDKKLLKLRQLNRSGYAEIVMGMNTENRNSPGYGAFMAVKASKSEEYPYGHLPTA